MVGATLFAAATFGIFFVAASGASGPCPIPGNFEIDGDMTQATCTPAADDWNTSGLGVQTSSQSGTYNTNNKDADPTSGWTSGGGTPDKADFQRAYSFARVVNGHYFVFLAWERTATSGTQSYNIELDNSGANVAADGTPQPNRSNGGAVFYIDAQGGGLPTFGSDCTFTSQSDYGSTCSNSQAGYTAAFNSVDITDPLNGNATVSAGGFDEIALDVTALTGIAPSCPGPTAASLYLRSATGTNHKNLKGYMAPFVLQPNSTCVPPPISTTATNADRNNTPSGLLNARGSTQFDTVTVGTAQSPGVGSVKFFLCTPANLTANGDCATGGTQVGSAKTLNGSGQASSDNVTGATTPNDNTDGKYCWRAEFTPGATDHNYLPGSDSNGDSSGVVGAECFTIVHKSPTIATQIALTGQNKPGLGFTSLGDTATLSGYAGNTDGETITFKLYGPFANGVTPVCDAGHLIAGATTTGTLSSGSATTSQTYQPTAAGTYVWIASYNGDSFNDGIAGTCSDANESGTIVASQVSVAKTANPAGPVSAGDPIGFDITVTNPGSVPATGVHVHDVLPAGADGVAGGDLNWALDPAYTGCAITGAVGSQVLDCNFSQVDPGSLPVIHISSSTAPADCGVVKNKATVSTTNGSGTDSDVASVTVQCPDLSVTKLTGNGTHTQTVNAGDPVEFTILVANAGPGTAKNVGLDDPLPNGTKAGWTIKSQTNANQCSISAGDLTCSGVDLGAGDSYSIDITAATDQANCTTYDNTATASSDNAGSPTDEAIITCQKPGLSVTKLADNGKHAQTVDAGDDIGFTITVANNGPGTANGVTLDDVLPAGSGAGVSWSIDSGPSGDATPTCSISSGSPQELTCSAVDLGAGKSYSLHIKAKTSFAECTEYDNTATASADNAPDASDSADITCNTGQVSITKTADHSAPVHAGDQIGFTVEVKNSGTGAAHGVALKDPLPAGSGSGVTWAIDQSTGTPGQFALSGAAGSQTLSLASSTLPAGADYKVHVVAQTSQTECGVYDNTATLTTTNANNPNPVSASESCAFRVDLSVTKAGSPATQDLGQGNITWTIVVTNNGPDTDTGVTIADPMPGGNTFVSATASQGSCTGGAILNCNLGTMAAGSTVTITLVTTPSAAGAQTNTVTVAGNRPETNTANNQATATVQVTAPFVPPPVYCVAVSKITPHQLFVGRKTMLTIHLTKHGKAAKGVRVLIKGPKLHVKTKRSNARGIVKQVVKMRKAGIDTFIPLASKRCNTKRIGVTGVFTPPVTG
ncbi:MAG TPA: DUF11 domain-containing protein [Gaiellaceae bacterium]|nr:DUF11 domain-containing protein [Gaiellaceae bacterium]